MTADPGDPLAALDAAIRGLLEHDGRTVSGWAIVASVESLDAEVAPFISPLRHGLDYSVAPATSPSAALGMVDALAAKLRRIARSSFEDEE